MQVVSSNDIMVDVQSLKKYYPVRKGMLSYNRDLYVKALDRVSFSLRRGQSLGIAGESGCGKTTTGRLLLRLEEPSEGRILFKGQDISTLRGPALRNFRRRAQLVFQNPFEAMNPRFTIFRSVLEPLLIHGIGRNMEERKELVRNVLEKVNLRPVTSFFDKYPHQVSGGQLQRAVIARALVLSPEFVVADEPVSMLDVSVRAGILNLLKDISTELDLTVVYISHDLSLIRHICDMTCVMYLGRICEIGPTEAVIEDPKHPYTRALLSAVPVPDPDVGRREVEIKDLITSAIHIPPGCRFHPRCPVAREVCASVDPPEMDIEPGRRVSCHLYNE